MQEVYNKFREVCGGMMSRNIFVRRLKDIDDCVVYKQKKIEGAPVLTFFGVKLKEQRS